MSATDSSPPAALAPEAIDALVITGYEAIEARDLGRALDKFETALAAGPDRADCLHGMGVIALMLDKVDRAKQFLEAAAVQANAQLDPASQATIYADLGQCYLAGGSIVHAVKAWLRAHSLTNDPVFRQWVDDVLHEQFLAAIAAYEAGEVDHATTICSVIVDLVPEHERALFLLGAIVAANGALETAEMLLRRALDQIPEATDTLTGLATVLHRLSRFDEALSTSERVLRLTPGHAQASMIAGMALADMARHAEAEPLLRRAIEAMPDDADALCKLGVVVAHLGSEHEARALLENAARLGGPGHVAWTLLARMTNDPSAPDADRA